MASHDSRPSSPLTTRGSRPRERRERAHLVVVDVAVGLADHFLARPRLRDDGREVAHRPDGTKSAASRPKTAAARSCSRFSVGILEKDVVADLGLGHGSAHGGGRTGDGVGAQIDGTHEPNHGRGCRRLRDSRALLTRPSGACEPQSGQAGRPCTRATTTRAQSTSRSHPGRRTACRTGRTRWYFQLYLGILLHIYFRLQVTASGSLRKRFFQGSSGSKSE